MHCMVVLGRMLIFGTVTTTNMATGKTKPQVNPGIAHFKAFFTSFRSIGSNSFFGTCKMLARGIHNFIILFLSNGWNLKKHMRGFAIVIVMWFTIERHSER